MTQQRANLLLLLSGALWGMGFVAQSTAMAAIGPLLFVSLRFAIATLGVLPFALREARNAAAPLNPVNRRGFVIIGCLLFATIATQQIGLLTTTVTNSGFLTGLYVVMVPVFAVILFRQWPHPVVWVAAVVALCGIWMLSGAGAMSLRPGDWLTILCAAFAAFQMIMINRHAAGSGRPITLAVTQFAVCSALATLGALLFEPIEWHAIMRAAPEILYAGIFSGGIAFTLQAIGQRYTTPAQAAIFLSSEAVFAALFAAIFLAERIAPIGLVGCGLIFAAILAVELVPLRAARKTAVTT